MRPKASEPRQLVKVGEIEEIPPGKGKIMTVAGHEVTVYNREGRFVATATPAPRYAPGVLETTCDMPGHKFDVGAGPGVTPDRLQTLDVQCEIVVSEDGIFVVIIG